MNDQNQNTTSPVNPTPAPSAFDTPPEQPSWKLIIEQLKPLPKILWAKFYANKKIFWPITIAFGLIFFVLLLGLIFGKRGTKTIISNRPTPTPFILTTPIASPSAGVLLDSQKKLDSLKVQIQNLDVKQSKLTPPTINFDIRF